MNSDPNRYLIIILTEINFLGASTQTPQVRLPPAAQERGIGPNLATFGISLYDASIEELDPLVIKYFSFLHID